MKSPKSTDKKGRIALCLLLGIAILGMLPTFVWAQAPGWWVTRGVQNTDSANHPANDYAAVNQGQVKNIVVKAVAELDANLPGGAGDTLHTLATKLSGTTPNTDDYDAVNIGQLKTVAKPFYDLLIHIGYMSQYPWTSSTNAANDYAIANIGQVKNLFNFDVTFDGDVPLNGLPDWWERHWFNGQTGIVATGTAPRGDMTILQAYQQGLNPLDYFDGQLPTLQIVGGNNQSGTVNTFLASAIVVHVTNSAGVSLVNAPVTFSVSSGSGLLRVSDSSAPAISVELRTDELGNATVWYQLPDVASSTNVVTCTAVSGSENEVVTITSTSIANSGAVVLYVSTSGNDWNSGISPAPGVNGPKQTIGGGLSAALSGDTLQLAAGTYTETSLQPGSKTINIVPIGEVHIK